MQNYGIFLLSYVAMELAGSRGVTVPSCENNSVHRHPGAAGEHCC